MKKLLTIAIPTFDRLDRLVPNVARLRAQLTPACTLVVIDNHSAKPVSTCLPDDVTVIRNPHNIGMIGNINRCFEVCETPWLWVTSDDDEVDPDAIRNILSSIESHADAVMLSFLSRSPWTPSRADDVRCVGLTEFIERFDSWMYLTWISTNVFQCSALISRLRFGYNFAYTLMSFLVMVMLSLKEGGEVWLLRDSLVTHTCLIKDKRATSSWRFGDFELGLGTIFDLPMGHRNRRVLARKIGRMQLKMHRDLIALALGPGARAEPRECRFLFQAKWRRYLEAAGFAPDLYLRYAVGLAASYFPGLLRLAIPQIYRVTRGKEMRIDKAAWFQRL